MKLIRVNKKFGNSGSYTTHYINVNHIIDVYEWSNSTIIVLSNGEKIECLEVLTNILDQINKS